MGLAIQGLWAGPWLRDVAGLDADAAAGVLMWTAAGMVTGFLSRGFLAERLGRRGVPPAAVATGGMAAFMAVQLMLVWGVTVAGQWGIGEVISLYPPAGAGYAPAGYRAGFGLMLALQAAGAVWYLVAGRWRAER